MRNKKLYRSRDNRIIAGIAGGLGDYLEIDPTVIRVILVIALFISFGTFAFAYLVLILVIPPEPENHQKKVGNNQNH